MAFRTSKTTSCVPMYQWWKLWLKLWFWWQWQWWQKGQKNIQMLWFLSKNLLIWGTITWRKKGQQIWQGLPPSLIRAMPESKQSFLYGRSSLIISTFPMSATVNHPRIMSDRTYTPTLRKCLSSWVVQNKLFSFGIFQRCISKLHFPKERVRREGS